jgi:ribonuclease HI
MAGGNRLKVFHIDGAGVRPDGTGSGYAWVRLDKKDVHRIRWADGLTNNQAEYSALISVLRYVRPESCAIIWTDSQLVTEQFRGRWAVNNPDLIELLCTARELISQKSLHIEVKWIPRLQNKAGLLLERTKQNEMSRS